MREGRRLSQAQCADRAGISRQQWNRVEQRCCKPHYSTACHIAAGLGVDTALIFRMAGLDVRHTGLSPEATHIAFLYDKNIVPLPEEGQRLFAGVFEALMAYYEYLGRMDEKNVQRKQEGG